MMQKKEKKKKYFLQAWDNVILKMENNQISIIQEVVSRDGRISIIQISKKIKKTSVNSKTLILST